MTSKSQLELLPVLILTKQQENQVSQIEILFQSSELFLVTRKISGHRLAKEAKKQVKKATNEKPARTLPLWVNGSVLLLFCALGAWVYLNYAKDETKFIHAFFMAFNLVANLTMGEMPRNYDLFTVLYIVFFVTFGLAVLSMCAELAASGKEGQGATAK